MTENTQKKWCVYVHISPSGKRYIGITCRKPNERWKNGKGYIDSPYFYNAIQKYGWDNFSHIILKDNLEEQEAKQMEIDLIAEFDSTNRDKGYNISKGGDGVSGVQRFGEENSFYGKHHSDETKGLLSELRGIPVCQFDLDMKFIKEYRSAKLAENETGIYQSMILGCCHKSFGYKTAGGFVWIFKSDLPNIDFDEYKKWLNHEKMPKRICQYSLNAVFIREFDSIADASNFTGIPASNLSLAVSGKYKQAGGYLWALKGVEHIKPYKKPCCREVCQFSLNMELLNVFESRVTAGNSIGVTPQAIGCACNSKTNISHGYIWKFKDDYEREVANGT